MLACSPPSFMLLSRLADRVNPPRRAPVGDLPPSHNMSKLTREVYVTYILFISKNRTVYLEWHFLSYQVEGDDKERLAVSFIFYLKRVEGEGVGIGWMGG